MPTHFALRCCFTAWIATVSAVAVCHAESVIHWTNRASQDVIDVLNNNATFTTDFKGVNDVQVSKPTGTVTNVFQEGFGGSSSGNNPLWIRAFVGYIPPQTGDGVSGRWSMLQPSSSANSFQFDFSIPLGPGDRMMIADVDQSEKYQIVAYKRVGGVYQTVSLSGWTHDAFSGETGVTPDARWATWNAADGTLTSTGSGLTEPLDVLAPDQNVDRVVFINFGGGGGTPAVQFAANIAQITLPGDYNRNGIVDAPDYVLWRNTLGQSGTNLAADGDQSNSVDSGDYTIWKSHFGQTPAVGTSVANARVPEPAAGLALVIAMILVSALRFQRVSV